MKALRQLTVLGFHAIRAAPIDIEHPKTLSQFRADQCLTRQRHALFGSIERGNDAASELRRFQLKAIFFGPVALQTISIAFPYGKVAVPSFLGRGACSRGGGACALI
jgi:hypothetical protein